MTLAAWMLKPAAWRTVGLFVLGWVIVAGVVLAPWPWPWWAERFLLFFAGWWTFRTVSGLVKRAEARAQRRTEAYVQACEAAWRLSAMVALDKDRVTVRYGGDA